MKVGSDGYSAESNHKIMRWRDLEGKAPVPTKTKTQKHSHKKLDIDCIYGIIVKRKESQL